MPELHELRPFALRDRNGRILFTDYNARSMGDAMVKRSQPQGLLQSRHEAPEGISRPHGHSTRFMASE